jgi:hypothetical protein
MPQNHDRVAANCGFAGVTALKFDPRRFYQPRHAAMICAFRIGRARLKATNRQQEQSEAMPVPLLELSGGLIVS